MINVICIVLFVLESFNNCHSFQSVPNHSLKYKS